MGQPENTTGVQAPFRAPALFWLAVAALIASNVAFFVRMPSGEGVADWGFAGAAFALLGVFCILNPVQLHRIAPYGHGGNSEGVRILGWLLAPLGTLMTLVAVVVWLIGSLG